MTDEDQKRVVHSRVKKKTNTWPYFLVILLLGCGIGYYVYIQVSPAAITANGSQTNVNGPERLSQDQDQIDSTTSTNVKVTGLDPIHLGSKSRVPSPPRNSTGNNGQEDPTPSVQDSMEQGTANTNTADTADTADTAEDNSPAAPFITTLNSFYTHLDNQHYMKEFGLKEPSKVHFSKLLQRLIDNPPIVARETDDLFTLLKNTAHFFRVLGKNNIIILKGILDREKSSVESTLRTFYSLIDYPDQLQKEYQLSIRFEALYDYAGFFLNTMGGRLYLFRRDSTSRMVVSYYAIMIIDRANTDGNSKHGIDIVPAIDFLIEEMETGGKKLEMKEVYLDTLYDLKEKYN